VSIGVPVGISVYAHPIHVDRDRHVHFMRSSSSPRPLMRLSELNSKSLIYRVCANNRLPNLAETAQCGQLAE